MLPYYQDDFITIYNADCRQVLPQIQDVGLCITSPPYLNQRKYELAEFDWYSVVPQALASVQLAERGQMLVNLGVIHQNGEIVPYWDELSKRLKADGFHFFGWYVWNNGEGLPGNWSGRLAPAHEWIFHFNKQSRQINKICKCVWAGTNKQGKGLRKADGTVGLLSKPGPVNDYKIPGSVVSIYREQERVSLAATHPARFPIAFADFLIRAFGQSGDVILDPFMGSGTTLYAAKQLNYRSVGIDISERYCKMAAERCAQEVLLLSVQDGLHGLTGECS